MEKRVAGQSWALVTCKRAHDFALCFRSTPSLRKVRLGMRIADVNCLVEVRRGRKVWVKSRSTTPATGITVMFVHGGCANLQQVRSEFR